MKYILFTIAASLLVCCSKNEKEIICGEKRLNEENVVTYQVLCDSTHGYISVYERTNDRFDLKHDYYQIGVRDIHYNLSAIDTCLKGASGYKAFHNNIEFFSIKRKTNCSTGTVEETSKGNCLLTLDTTYKKSHPIISILVSYPEGFTDSVIVYKNCLDCVDNDPVKANRIKSKRNFVEFDTTQGKEWNIEVDIFLNSGQKFTCEKRFEW